MKKIQLFLKYLVLMLFLTVWIIIMFFTDYMNSQSVKLYCMFVVGCGCAYSIWEKTYVPDARSYIAEKALALNHWNKFFEQPILPTEEEEIN